MKIPYGANMTNNINDFGFSLVSEDELRAQENELRASLVEKEKIVVQATEHTQTKLTELHAMVRPFLNNLAVNSDKNYIYWPNRVTEMNVFLKKIDAFMKEALK